MVSRSRRTRSGGRSGARRNGGPVHGVGWLAAELDFDAIEVENATPGFYVFNRMARRLNIGLGAAETGSSDAHILDAVGRAYTEFRGRTAADLRRSIEARDDRGRPIAVQSRGFDALRGVGIQPPAIRRRRSLS